MFEQQECYMSRLKSSKLLRVNVTNLTLEQSEKIQLFKSFVSRYLPRILLKSSI